MNRIIRYTSLLSVVLFSLNLNAATSALILKNGFIREMPKKTRYTAAYFTLENPGSRMKTLVHISTPIAREVQLHETISYQNQVSMERKQAFHIPAHGQLKLDQSAKHIMLLGLKGTVVAGNTVPLKLHFKDGSNQTITLPIHAAHTLTHDH